MDAFLDKSAFAEPPGGRDVSMGSGVAQARFDGCVAFTNWARREVQDLLPPGLDLATNVSPAADLHPVAFVFGALTAGAMQFGGFTIPTGIGYQEFAMAIPFVRLGRRPFMHTYIPRMYSSYFPPTWNGNMYYGFAKEMARMHWQDSVFLITSEDDRLLLHATVQSGGRWLPGDTSTLDNFSAMREIFALPIVGRKADGTYVCSYFDWDFSAASVRPADACVGIDAPLLDGLVPRRCSAVPSGTFDIRGMVWKLSWPAPYRP